MINENLDELSPLLRTAFVLREVQGYSTGEAAKKLGYREHAEGALWRRVIRWRSGWGRRLKEEGRYDGNHGRSRMQLC